jgi:hypothetical protein
MKTDENMTQDRCAKIFKQDKSNSTNAQNNNRAKNLCARKSRAGLTRLKFQYLLGFSLISL